MKKILSAFICFFVLISFSSGSFAADKVLVFAAASTTNMLDDVIKLYNAQGGNVAASYAGSGTLAKQIESGAPASIFISADEAWMDYLEKSDSVIKNTRQPLVGNELVMIAPATSNISFKLDKNTDLAKILNGSKIAIGSPDSVPAGKYAKSAFVNLGLWDQITKNIVEVENVRVALAFVARNEALLGVVFATDAAIDKNVKIVAQLPVGSYESIIYPSAIVKGADTKEVQKFYAFLRSAEAKDIYKKYGFKVY